MEQSIWVIFGVIALLLSFGIIGNLIYKSQGDVKFNYLESGLDKLKSQCNYVCNSPPDTKLSVTLDLPSGMYLTANNTKICGQLEEEIRCERCDCNVSTYQLHLNTSMAKKMFFTHPYKCYFERGENVLFMECEG